MRYLFALLVALFLSSALDAQVHVNVNINLGSQPVWGPTGYDYVEYYYLPDIDAYYYVPQHRFYYFEGGRWIYRSSLPSRYGNFDLYNSYKVVVNEREPWRNNETYRQKYASYKGRHDQQPIRDSKDSKYFVNKNHPQHNTWVQQQNTGKGNVKSIGNNNKGNVRSMGNDKGNVRSIGNNKGNVRSIGNDKGNVRSTGNSIGKGNGNNKVTRGNNNQNKQDNGKGKGNDNGKGKDKK
jgi:hypothetical protein